MSLDNQKLFNAYREQYKTFTFYDFEVAVSENEITLRYDFRIDDSYRFQPQMRLQLGRYAARPLLAEEIEGLAFHIGMIELISYWKSFCPSEVHIRRSRLSESQQDWWKKLYYKGLGEFFYHNGIKTSISDLLHFTFEKGSRECGAWHYLRTPESQRCIVPIGGGKDSVVTLEQLRGDRELIPFIINPRGATIACARIAGFSEANDCVVLHRQIDPLLLTLNQQGALNGHTPFSAMLAFYTLLVSYATNTRDIALSNESSANEPTIPGTDINHQYSKSAEFEQDFQEYVLQHMNDCSHYYSHLRPYSELQIARFFAQYPAYFPHFKSCNAGSKQDIWCCNCPKCLFAYIILSPFIDDATMISIFGEDLLDKASLQHYFDELCGLAEQKPFECVGTIAEVNQALEMICESRKEKYLVKHWIALHR